MVQQRCPEWTDHNVSDPGVTLIETFAFMVDQLLYRLNRVPDRLYITFLDLIGVTLHPPTPAHVDVTFWLSAPPEEDVVLPAARGRHPAHRPGRGRGVRDHAAIWSCRRAPCARADPGAPRRAAWPRDDELSLATEFACFSEPPASTTRCCSGSTTRRRRARSALRFDCKVQGVGVDPLQPPLVWEAWDGYGWVGCEVDPTSTGGLNRPGDVIIHVPRATRVGDRQGARRLAALPRRAGREG